MQRMETHGGAHRILLAIPLDVEPGRGIARGVRDYERSGRKGWVFQIVPPGLMTSGLPLAPVDGIIAHLNLRSMVAPVRRLRRPVVNVSNAIGDALGLPRVGSDEDRIGRLAAEHFLERGFRDFAFFGNSRAAHSRARETAFRSRLAESGCGCDALSEPASDRLAYGVPGAKEIGRILPWMRALPKPVAVFASTARLGFELLEICRREAFRVPHDIAVLAVDNDEVLCDLSCPPLSAVRPAYERIGFEAAALLDRLMAGNPKPSRPVLVPPDRVVVRQSTDLLAVQDLALEKALRFIRDHLDGTLRGNDIASRAGVSRRLLERKFRTVVGSSPLQEVRRLRVERARQLLLETNLPMPPIAERCGFATPQLFTNVFHRQTGKSPTAYRRLFSRLRPTA